MRPDSHSSHVFVYTDTDPVCFGRARAHETTRQQINFRLLRGPTATE